MRYRKVPRFLRDKDSAFRWALKNVGDIKGNVQEMNEEHPGLGSEFYGRRAEAYSDFANEAYNQGNVVAHRAIEVPFVDDVPQIQFHNLGKSWSREPAGAGVYGQIPYRNVPLKNVILTGAVKPVDIDWEYGFASFMYYGEDQWEVSMLRDAPVLVTHLDEVLLPQAILGNSGKAEEDWRPVGARNG